MVGVFQDPALMVWDRTLIEGGGGKMTRRGTVQSRTLKVLGLKSSAPSLSSMMPIPTTLLINNPKPIPFRVAWPVDFS